MNKNRMNDLLAEIVDLASVVLVSDDDTAKHLALGNIQHLITEERNRFPVKPMVPPTVIPHDEPAAEVPRTEAEKQRQREIEHFSFCSGMFPIHTVRTPSGRMGKCEINGRKFSFSSVDASGPDDHACTVRIWDGGNQIAFMTVLRGRGIAEPMAMGAFKAYVKQLSGSKKFHGRGGFLKQALKRLQEKGQE